MICFPILLVTAEDRYHIRQSNGNFEALYSFLITSDCDFDSIEGIEDERIPPSIWDRLDGNDILLFEA